MTPGDPSCWSHLTCATCGRIHENGGTCDAADVAPGTVMSVGPIIAGSAGVASNELNATCVVLVPGASLPPAVLDRDVAFVVTAGTGWIDIEGDHPRRCEVTAGRVVVVASGSRRLVTAGPDGLAWTTVHRRRKIG